MAILITLIPRSRLIWLVKPCVIILIQVAEGSASKSQTRSATKKVDQDRIMDAPLYIAIWRMRIRKVIYKGQE